MTDILDELQWRGLIVQHTDIDVLREHLATGPVTFYCGFDPTTAPLRHSHLVQILLMRHLQLAGHHPPALVDGATEQIGDPRQSGECQLQPSEVARGWADRLKSQISYFLDFEGPAATTMVNDFDWTAELSAIDLLRGIGKYFRVGTMLSKDIAACRLTFDEGISYTEFSYQILQANGFPELYRRYGATMETGGNGQWGNMIGGVNLIHKVEGATTHVLTTSIVTKSDGTKSGKPEGGAIWPDPQMISPYAFYQFWLRVEDADVVRFLKIFTFLDHARIEELGAEVAERLHIRNTQKALVAEATHLVHGEEELDRALVATNALWGGGDLHTIDEQTLSPATSDLPQTCLKLGEATIIDALVETGLEKGENAARRTLASDGAYLNNIKAEDEDAPICVEDLLAGSRVLVHKGRRSLTMVELSQNEVEFF